MRSVKTTKRRGRSKVFWRLFLPLAAGGVIGGISYVNPSLIPPAYIILQPEFNPLAGPPISVDPVSVGVLNGVIYGGGALILALVMGAIFRK